MKVCLNHYATLLECIDQIEKTVLPLLLPYQNQINLILTVPGIKDISAITIFSEIGPDMSVFKDSEYLCSWAGLAHGCNESACKKKSVKISRAGVYLKPALVEVAHCAVKDKTNDYFAKKFNLLSKCRGKKRAYITIARKILVAIYHMLSTGELFIQQMLLKLKLLIKIKLNILKIILCNLQSNFFLLD